MMLAAIRADIHNTAGKAFNQHFTPQDFMGATADLENRIAALVKKGYSPSAAVAMATSKQTAEQRMHLVDKALTGAGKRKAKGKGKRWPTKSLAQ